MSSPSTSAKTQTSSSATPTEPLSTENPRPPTPPCALKSLEKCWYQVWTQTISKWPASQRSGGIHGRWWMCPWGSAWVWRVPSSASTQCPTPAQSSYSLPRTSRRGPNTAVRALTNRWKRRLRCIPMRTSSQPCWRSSMETQFLQIS